LTTVSENPCRSIGRVTLLYKLAAKPKLLPVVKESCEVRSL
jgi:hypothetical protein